MEGLGHLALWTLDVLSIFIYVKGLRKILSKKLENRNIPKNPNVRKTVKGRVTQTLVDITLVDARCLATGTFEKPTTGRLGSKRNRGSYSREMQTSLEDTTRTAVAGIALNHITTCLQKTEVDKATRTSCAVTSYYHKHRDPFITPPTH